MAKFATQLPGRDLGPSIGETIRSRQRDRGGNRQPQRERELVYYMFGEYDGMVIVDMPDASDVAATSIAVTSTGAFSKVETRPLIAPATCRRSSKRPAAHVRLTPRPETDPSAMAHGPRCRFDSSRGGLHI